MPDRINGNSFDGWDANNPSPEVKAQTIAELQTQTNDDLPQDTKEAWQSYKEKTSAAQARDKAGEGIVPDL